MTGTGAVRFADLSPAERAAVVDDLLRPFVRTGEPKYTPEEVDRLGAEVFERAVRPQLPPDADGRFVAVDVETGAFEIDSDLFTAHRRLLVRLPGCEVWTTRAGYVPTVTYRLGWKRA